MELGADPEAGEATSAEADGASGAFTGEVTDAGREQATVEVDGDCHDRERRRWMRKARRAVATSAAAKKYGRPGQRSFSRGW